MKIIQNVNDVIALLLIIVIIPGTWLLIGFCKLELPGEIIGATIVAWTLVLQYYFRRKPQEPPTAP